MISVQLQIDQTEKGCPPGHPFQIGINSSEQVAQLPAVEEIAGELIVLLPHRKRMAASSKRTFFGIFLQAGYRRESALHDLKYLTYSIFFRLAAESITAAFTAYSAKQTASDQVLDDDLQILLGDMLSLGYVLERDIAITTILCKIYHDAQSITSLS